MLGLGLGLYRTNMLHLSFMSYGQVMSKNCAGDIGLWCSCSDEEFYGMLI